MNKKLLSVAVLAGIAGSASAVNVNPDGLGQVLLYPYYTASNGLNTQIQVVNTTNTVKAVKVRFNEGVNTWDVFDFNLYLSPYDVWNGMVAYDATEKRPEVSSPDTSCIVPKALGKHPNGQALRPTNFKFDNADVKKLIGGKTVEQRLSEGHIEIFDMGTVVNSTLAAAATHNTPGAGKVATPGNCAALTSAWKPGGYWRATTLGGARGVNAPEGGLFGSARIINVAKGISRGYDATAIDGFYDKTQVKANDNKDGKAPAHALPGNAYPNIAGTGYDTKNGTIQIGDTTSHVMANTKSGPQIVKTEFKTPSEAVTSLFMVDALYNQYVNKPTGGWSSDWVITFPTKHAFVNKDTAKPSALTEGQFGMRGNCPQKPTDADFCSPFKSGYNVPVEVTYYDTEEQRETADLDFSPSATAAQDAIPYEVNVLQFSGSGESSVFNSVLSNDIKTPYSQGWARVNFTGGEKLVSKDKKTTFYGAPAMGFSVLEFRNGNLNGTLANYAELYEHKYSRNISVSSQQ